MICYVITSFVKMFHRISMRKSDARCTTKCFVIIITMLQVGRCENQFLNLMEGDQAYLIFRYSCGIHELILQAGNRAPFYHSGGEDGLLLTPYQEHRFMIENISSNNSCILNLTISNVQRDDAGTYTCFVYKDTEILLDFIQIGVHVEYPPGRVACRTGGPHQSGNWISLQCTAPVGSLSGQIECYQNGKRMPSLNSPLETNISLKQTILINKSNFVVCCTSTFRQPKKRCECCDTIVDPTYDRQVAGPEDICFDTIPVEGLTTSSLGPTSDSDVPETTAHLQTAATQLSDISPSILVICLSVFVPIIVISCLCIVILAVHRRENLCTSRSQRTQDGVYSSVHTEIADSRV